MDDPWSSPWTTVDDDPSKRHPPEVPAAPPAAAVAFPPSVRFDSLWGDDSFGGWGVPDTRIGGHGALSSTDGPKTNGFEDQSGGFGAYTTGTGVASAFSSLSPEADPWATEVSYSSFEDAKNKRDDGAQRILSPVDEPALDHAETSDASPIASPELPVPKNDSFCAVEDRNAVPEPNDSRPPSPAPYVTDGPRDEVLSIPKHRDTPPDPQSESSRQVSKVQELVDMYDGIAKKATSAPPPVMPRPRKKASGSDNAESGDEEEDGENQDGGEEKDEEEKDADEDEDWPEDFEIGDSEPQVPEPLSPHAPPSPNATREPPPKFDIDMSQIPTLFNNLADPSITVPAELPDHPDLNFSTVTERKAWYRLSRQGSSRLHDFGDDENYRGVSWRGSAISEETFAIVRRWMQEGSVMGGARGARGGRFGGRSAATFGWDQSSSSDPVDLSFLHRKRASLDETKKSGGLRLSLDMPPAFAPVVSPVKSSMNGAAKTPKSRPVSMPVAPTQFRSGAKSNHKPSPLAISTTVLSGTPVTPKSATPITPKTITTTTKPAEDDDEEWGEMVSSPQTSTNTNGWGQSSTSIPDSGVDFAMSPVAKPASISSPDGSSRGGSQSKPSVRFAEPTIRGDTGSTTSSPLAKSFPPSPPSQPPSRRPVVGTTSVMMGVPASDDLDRLEGRTKSVATINVTNNESNETEELTEAEEAAVRRVVSGLPDLSYMLR